LIYYEAYLERDDALGRERYLKSGSGRKFLKTQLRRYLNKIRWPREHRFYAAGVVRSQGCEHDDDLHACAESAGLGSEKPAGLKRSLAAKRARLSNNIESI